MLWKEKLEKWKSGIAQGYPCDITKRFFYETSQCRLDKEYIETYIPSDILDSMEEDSSPFEEHFKHEKYIVAIPNLSNTSILIIPISRKRKKLHDYERFYR